MVWLHLSKARAFYAAMLTVAICLTVLVLRNKETNRKQATAVRVLGDPKNPEKINKSNKIDEALQANSNSAEAGLSSICPGYAELRNANFRHPALARSLCKGVEAFKLIGDQYPVCELRSDLPQKLVEELKKTTKQTFINNAITRKPVVIYTYPAREFVSNYVLQHHVWEPEQISRTLSIAKKFSAGSVTFLDIGCNIGTYSLQARAADIPTVAVDANLRNLLRVRMSANEMGWPADASFRLVWMYFHTSVSLRYLRFPADSCNVGATRNANLTTKFITDNIPVMTGRGDVLVDSIRTQLVVMKMDIETYEYAFLSTAHRLFRERTIVSVQMELWRLPESAPASKSPNYREIVSFFQQRNYTMFAMNNLNTELNVETTDAWDVIWIRRDYLSTLRG